MTDATLIDLGESPAPPEPGPGRTPWRRLLRTTPGRLRAVTAAAGIAVVLFSTAGSAVGGGFRPLWSVSTIDQYLTVGAANVYYRPTGEPDVVVAQDLHTGEVRWRLPGQSQRSDAIEFPGVPDTVWLVRYGDEKEPYSVSRLLDPSTGAVRACLAGTPSGYIEPAGPVLMFQSTNFSAGPGSQPDRPADCVGPELRPGLTAVHPSTGAPVWHIPLPDEAGHVFVTDADGRLRWLATWVANDPIDVWDVQTGAWVGRLSQEPPQGWPPDLPTAPPTHARIGGGDGVLVLTEDRGDHVRLRGYAVPAFTQRWTTTLPMPPVEGRSNEFRYVAYQCGRLPCVTVSEVTFALDPATGRALIADSGWMEVYGRRILTQGRNQAGPVMVRDAMDGTQVAVYEDWTVVGGPHDGEPLVLARSGPAGTGLAVVPELGAPPRILGVPPGAGRLSDCRLRPGYLICMDETSMLRAWRLNQD